MTTPSVTEVKRLFARSRNKCAFPNCNAPIVEESGTITGEICHIKASSSGGPRYDKTQSEAQRHAASNLILLCRRHHKIIDTEPLNYTVEKLTELKKSHEDNGLIEITPAIARAANVLLEDYTNIIIHSNIGQIAIKSPGSIQANTVNLKTTKTKFTVTPPIGSIGENRKMLSYIKYLIDRYNEYQKAHAEKSNPYKYMAIHNSLKRKFKGKWQLMPISMFNEIVEFLYVKIDNTKIGRINKSRGTRNFHTFEEHK